MSCDPCNKCRKTKHTNKNIKINGDLEVKCETHLNELNVSGDTILSNVTVNGNQTVLGDTTLSNVVIDGNLTTNGPVVHNDTVTFNGEIVQTIAPNLITVDPAFVNPNGVTEFHTVEEAVNSLKTKKIVPPVKVKLADGVHDSIVIKDFQRSVQGRQLTPNIGQALDEGVFFIGDERPIVGQSYVDSVLNVANSRNPTISITTNVVGVGPFNATIANFGGFPQPPIVRPGVLSNNAGVPPVSEQAIAPILNGAAIATNIGICRRGTIGFNVKGANLEAVGAVAMICINNVPGNDTLVMADAGIPVTIPCVMIGQNDGNALLSAIALNPGMLITIASATPNKYVPSFGTYAGNTDLSHPLADLSRLDVTMTTAPTLDPGRPNAAIGIENPNFADPELGPVVPGDTVIVLLDSGVSVIRTIDKLEESVPASGFFNRLVFTAPLPSSASGPDASVTFRSKVICRSTDVLRPALLVNTSTALLQGISFTTGGFVGTATDQGYVNTSNVYLSNLTFENPDLQYNFGLQCLQSYVLCVDSNRDSTVPISFIAHAVSLYNDIANINAGNWTISTLSTGTATGLLMSGVGVFNSNSLRVCGKNILAGIRSASAARSLVNSDILHVSGAATGIRTLGTNGFDRGAIEINTSRYLSIVRNGVGMSLGRDDTVTTGAFEGYGPVTFSNVTRDFDLINSAKLILGGANVNFTGNQTYRVLDKAQLQVDNTTTFAPNGMKPYTANGPIDNALEQHSLNGASALAMTMAPNAGTRLYLGREYTITAGTAFAHTLTLSGGAQFFGNGFSGQTVATFSGQIGDYITLFVKDATTVLVRGKFGVA